MPDLAQLLLLTASRHLTALGHRSRGFDEKLNLCRRGVVTQFSDLATL